MIRVDEELHNKLVEAILSALQAEDQDTSPWEQLLRLYPAADAFAAILDKKVLDRLFPPSDGKTINRWLLNIQPWINEIQDPRYTPTVESSLLYILWDRFSTDLADNLRRSRVSAAIPTEGSVLAFVGRLTKCIVVSYRFSGLFPKLEPVAVLDSPKSAFDFWTAIDHATASNRNVLKRVLISGHKLVSHRGVLTHVDRRFEPRVFGPSIDTLVMAEILAQSLYERSSPMSMKVLPGAKLILEVGSGSGLLVSELARHLHSLTEIYCVDIESGAIACTEKNVRVASLAPGAPQTNLHLAIGSFDVRTLKLPFDLIVCNPPYIPLPPGRDYTNSLTAHYLGAVGGLELLTELLKEIPNLLAPNGKLLLMVSNLSLEETLNATPKNCSVRYPLSEEGYEVLFDVEDVLENPEWLNFLLGTGKLINRSDMFFHRLHPLWIGVDSI